MKNEAIELTDVDKIAIVTLNRPQKRNAFDASMFSALQGVTEKISQQLPRAIVITGTGDGAFCAGFDVNPDNPMVIDFLKAMEDADRPSAQKLLDQIRKPVDEFTALPVPIIANINGNAYGGGAELAVRCDLRTMDSNAQICFSEVKLGLMPDWGGGATLAHLLGPSQAADLILTARKVNAQEALRLGLVNRICAPGQSLEEALKMAKSISANGPKAVRHSLALIRKSRDLNFEESLAFEAAQAVDLITTGECMVGITAFLEKEIPKFLD